MSTNKLLTMTIQAVIDGRTGGSTKNNMERTRRWNTWDVFHWCFPWGGSICLTS